MRGRNAVVAAGLRNKLFDVVQLLYRNQGAERTRGGSTTGSSGLRRGRSLRSRPGGCLAERDSAVVARRAQGFDAQASTDGVRSTPTLLVGRSGGALRQVDETRLSGTIDALVP